MEYDKCVKCGFTPTPDGRQFNLKYQEKCYNTTTLKDCNWMDMDVREHMHVLCPDCGFLVGAKGCLDYKEQKDKTNKQWTQQSTIQKTSTGTRSTYVGGQGYVNPQDNKGGWDVNECPSCPMSETEAEDTTQAKTN